jgi:methylglyoxal synthase
MMHLVDALSKTKLSNFLRPEQLERLAHRMQLTQHTAGEVIVEDGSPAGFVALVLSGELHVVRNNVLVDHVAAGGFFGEAMFSTTATRTANIVAVGDVEMGILTIDEFDRLLEEDRETALRCKGYFEALYAAYQNKDEGDSRRFVALIAHNGMKPVLADFARTYKQRLEKYPLVATGTTGAMLHRKAGLLLSRKVQSGPLGGDQAIGSMIASGNIRAVIFFRDPLSSHPHHADIEALGRLSDVYYVPFATNPVTGEAVLDYLERETRSSFANPSFEQYTSRQASVVDQG